MAGETREATVTANLAAVKSKKGEENWNFIFAQLLTDINLSLAMLVDKSST